jgi:hypothetical protein
MRRNRVLLKKREGEGARLEGFWELPRLGEVPAASAVKFTGKFRHHITYNEYRVSVVRASVTKVADGLRWVSIDRLAAMPLTTLARKALKAAGVYGLGKDVG